MAHYLLKWDPEAWPVEKFLDYFQRYENGETLKWGCGNTQKTLPGDKFYLIKNGKSGGIIGSGSITSEPYRATHYEKAKADAGEEGLFIDVIFDYLVKPNGSIPILKSELDNPELRSTIWNVQGSGKSIPDPIASSLSKLWTNRVELQDFRSADEVEDNVAELFEGATKTIQVNAYERNADARRRCLNKWGHQCSVCNVHFELRYGPIGKGFMHVHHLNPLSLIKAEHKVDPINDLRPVCPNCHAMLHRRSPPLSIKELKVLFETYGS